MTLINKTIDWIRKHFRKDKVNSFSIIVILLYYYIGLLSYITTPIRPIYHLFTSSSSVAVLLRALMTALVCLYSLLVVIVNREKIQWKWAVIFIYILLFTLISTAISPQTYNYIYISNSNYQTIYWVQASSGFKRLFTMYLSSVSDFALAFCFLFILPLVVNNKKQIMILTLPIVIIGLLECVYSIIVERGEYIKLLNYTNPEYGGYNINIGASFGNKQDWGAFATVSFISALMSFFLIDSKNWKYKLFKAFLIISSLILFVFSVASLCKTAIMSEIFSYIFIAVYLIYYFFKKNKIVFAIYLFLLLFIVISLVAFYTIPSLHSNGILDKIYKITYNFIFGRLNEGTIFGRTSIWLRFVENLRTYNLFFGLSKGGVSTYSQVVTIEGQSSIHNGFAYFFGSYGLLGFSIYTILLVIVVRRIFRLFKYHKPLFFITLASFTAALVFSLAESEVLIISGSNPIFVFNILVCVFPQGYLVRIKKTKEGLNDGNQVFQNL